jgi:hypothetical protein
MTRTRLGFAALMIVGALVGWSCGEDDEENTGSACSDVDDCYPNLEKGKMLVGGGAVCLDKVPGGYCTHTCTQDSDCCAVKGECKTGFPQVCSPFESTGMKYCFLACEGAQVEASGMDATAYCHKNANEAFGCRSSGGGTENRKVCVP